MSDKLETLGCTDLILLAANEASLPRVCPLASMMYQGFLELSACAALG